MMSYDSDIKVIKNDICYIRKFIEEDRRKFDQHIEESKGYRKRVDELSGLDKSLKDHVNQDRWFYGLVFTFLTGIVIMLLKEMFFS